MGQGDPGGQHQGVVTPAGAGIQTFRNATAVKAMSHMVKMRRTRIEHMSSASPPIATK